MSMELLRTGDKINMFRDRSPDAVALDNLIRKTLRVSDPANAEEMAQALRNYYTTDREFMAREAAGMPFVSAPVQSSAPQAATSTSAEVEQAISDVERDLATLTTTSILKDIEPELRGWSTAVRQAIAGGIHAARFAIDPRQRDSAFAARRHLGNYARMARAVGTLTPAATSYFRSFAQSIDEVAAVILVLIGESLASTGIGGGKFILQVPVSEIQVRRDAVIFALRNLVDSTQDAYGPNEWPRGLQAYQQIMAHLGDNAQHDLRAIFQENELAGLMDELIHLAVGNTAAGYRALGSTAMMALERFDRLILFAKDLVEPPSPPFASFTMALELFLDAFNKGRQGSRLMTIARPPVLFYGLYGMKEDPASDRLLKMIIERGILAESLDCYCISNCEKRPTKTPEKDLTKEQIQLCLDKILYDIDRAIDLYALGTEDFGKPEQRAFACRRIIQSFVACKLQKPGDDCKKIKNSIDPLLCASCECHPSIEAGEIKKIKDIILQELSAQKKAESSYDSLLQAMAPSCFSIVGGANNPVTDIIDKTITAMGGDPEKIITGYTLKNPPQYETNHDELVKLGELDNLVRQATRGYMNKKDALKKLAELAKKFGLTELADQAAEQAEKNASQADKGNQVVQAK